MTTTLPSLNTCTAAFIGRGYVGLPLAVEFSKLQPCRRTGAALQSYGIEPVLVDPWVDAVEAFRENELSVLPTIPASNSYGAVIAAVAHAQFVRIPEASWRELLLSGGVLLDLKGVIPRALQPLRL